MIERKLRKSEFIRRLKHGPRSPLHRSLLHRYVKITDEEYENLIYEPLENG